MKIKNENEKEQTEGEVIDVEAYAKAGKTIPLARRYEIRVDKQKITVNAAVITGKQILAEVGKTPEQYNLYQHVRGEQTKPIRSEQKVDLTEPGVERFTTMKIENQEGEDDRPLRRSFELLPEDDAFLSGRYPNWETVLEGETRWLIIEGFSITDGYNVPEVRLALRMLPAYPDVQIDMAYFLPQLSRADGKPVNGLSELNIDGKNFQQWSRHRAPDQWRPDVDNVETHLLFVTAFLEQELKK